MRKPVFNIIFLRFLTRFDTNWARGGPWPSGRVSDSGARGGGVRYLPLPCCVLEQRHIYSPKSTGNTKEAVTLS